MYVKYNLYAYEAFWYRGSHVMGHLLFDIQSFAFMSNITYEQIEDDLSLYL